MVYAGAEVTGGGGGQDIFGQGRVGMVIIDEGIVDKETEKMMKKAKKLQEKKMAISNDVRRKKFGFKTRGKIMKKEGEELRRTHNNIFDWVVGERKKEAEKAEFEKKMEAEDENLIEVDIVDLDKED